MTTAPAPSERLRRKLAALFPAFAERRAAQLLLEGYGSAAHEREAERVRLAILKLAGADLDRLRRHVEMAKGDYRDVLAWAEYPAQSRSQSWRLPPKERARLVEQDRAQYQAWLDSDN